MHHYKSHSSTNKLLSISILYFTTLLLVAPFNLLSFDTYYYWDWSRHLALSYYDGSPMIAYFIKLSTLLFGDTLFALNLVAIVCTALTSWIIYKTARLFLSKEGSLAAMSLWLFSPLVTLDMLKQTTYDDPLVLFWSLTLFFTVRFIKFNVTAYPFTTSRGLSAGSRNLCASLDPADKPRDVGTVKDLYFIGISIGLMMLSKYTGVVLVLSLLVFLLTTSYRYLFKSPHFYAALLVSLILFSPVILWNAQHEWQSFLYQSTTHQLHDTVNPIVRAIKSFVFVFVPSLNFMLVPPVLYWLKRAKISGMDTPQRIAHLCFITCIIFTCFYLFIATQDTIREYWLTPYLITTAMLGGYCFQTFNDRKSTFLLITVYAIASFGIVLNNAFPFLTPQKTMYYQLMQSFNATHPQLPKTVITTGWLEARMLFFLKDKPQVYTLDCGSQQNQYALWSTEMMKNIKNKTLKEALYIDVFDRSSCVKHYFDQCVKLSSPSERYKNKDYTIFAYRCLNT